MKLAWPLLILAGTVLAPVEQQQQTMDKTFSAQNIQRCVCP
jgi:hypothetical protein